MKAKVVKFGTNFWLVNAGLAGGPHGSGKRMLIKYTRAIINVVLNEHLDDTSFVRDKHFGFQVRLKITFLDSSFLILRDTWETPL